MRYRDLPVPPLHIADGRRAALVGPLVRFRGGQQMPVRQAPPINTLDPRYLKCVDHHLACDCREAEQNEILRDLRLTLREVDTIIATAIEGHPTEVIVDGEARADLCCQCVGCKIARLTRSGINWSVNSREVDLRSSRW